MNLTTISRKTGIPVSTIFDRLRSHEGRLITKFTCLLDFHEMGFTVWAKVFVKVRPDKRNELQNYMYAHPSVNNIYRVNNGYDFTLDCVFRDMKDAEDFMNELEDSFPIIQRDVFHVIDRIVEEKLLAEEMT